MPTLPMSCRIAAALEHGDIVVAETDVAAEHRGVARQPLAVALGVAVARLDGQRQAEDHRLGGVEIVGVALDPHQRAHARAQLVRVERLGDEVVGAGLEALDPVLGLMQRGDEHDRDQPGRRRRP